MRIKCFGKKYISAQSHLENLRHQYPMGGQQMAEQNTMFLKLFLEDHFLKSTRTAKEGPTQRDSKAALY